jgi:catechol 2,3-dioxygenase-like lactoylglutathione lyase family enzyme
MVGIHHIAVTVRDSAASAAQHGPLFAALGYELVHVDSKVAVWDGEGPEILTYSARTDPDTPHVHGRIGWQHLAFRVDSPERVDELFRIAQQSGWHIVRTPRLFPRFADGYYATFLEDPDGIRFEIAYVP